MTALQQPRLSEAEALEALAAMRDEDFEDALPEDKLLADGSPVTVELIEELVESVHRLAGRPSLTAPGKHSPQITLRLSEPVNAQLISLAERTGKRRSDIVREALGRYLGEAA
jgi:Arc/MetJ-type ribon-helix-helix transcriptional regulator